MKAHSWATVERVARSLNLKIMGQLEGTSHYVFHTEDGRRFSSGCSHGEILSDEAAEDGLRRQFAFQAKHAHFPLMCWECGLFLRDPEAGEVALGFLPDTELRCECPK